MNRSTDLSAILFAAGGTFAVDLFFHDYGLASSLIGALVFGTVTAILLPLFPRSGVAEASGQ